MECDFLEKTYSWYRSFRLLIAILYTLLILNEKASGPKRHPAEDSKS